MPTTCTRKIEFDAAHRVMEHESKCRHLHGHRYTVELTVTANSLDALGRIIDFGTLKGELGGWVDEHLDHGAILNSADEELIRLCRANEWKVYTVSGNPTAEIIAHLLFDKARDLFGDRCKIDNVRVRETPNCWADYSE